MLVYTINCLPCFDELIKTLINGLSLRVVSKPNLLRKVRFEVFSNIISYLSISIKDFVREKKSATEKKKEPQEQFFNEIEHQTS